MLKPAIAFLLFSLTQPFAYGQTVAMARSIPADAAKGVLTPPIEQNVRISGQLFNAASGLQIRNERNLIVMPSTLQGALPVRYQFDQSGRVWRIWILTAAEQAAPDSKK